MIYLGIIFGGAGLLVAIAIIAILSTAAYFVAQSMVSSFSGGQEKAGFGVGNDEFNLPKVTQSNPLPAVFGRVRVEPHWIWAPQNEPHYVGRGDNLLFWLWTINRSPLKVEGGRQVRSYRGSGLLAISDGLDAVVGIYKDDNLIFEGEIDTSGDAATVRIGTPAERLGTATTGDQVRFYLGDQTNLDVPAGDLVIGDIVLPNRDYPTSATLDDNPDPAIYKGVALAWLDKIFLGDNVSSYPAFDFLVERYDLSALGVDFLPEKARIGDSINPSHLVYALLVYYSKKSPSLINKDAFIEAGNIFYAEQIGLSVLLTERESILDLIEKVESHVGCKVFVDPKTRLTTIEVNRGGYDVESLPVIDDTMIKAQSRLFSLGWDSTVTQYLVKYTSPETGYRKISAQIVNPANKNILESRRDSEIEFLWFTDETSLKQQIERESIRQFLPLRELRGRTHKAHFNIRPNMLFVYNSQKLGVFGIVMRCSSVSEISDGDQEVQFEAIEDIFSVGSGFAPDLPAPITPPDLTLADPPAALAVLDSQFNISGNTTALLLVAPPPTGTATGASVFADGNPLGNVELSPVAELADALGDDTAEIINTLNLENAGRGWLSHNFTDEQWGRGAAILLIENGDDYELITVKEAVVNVDGTINLSGIVRAYGTEMIAHDAGARVWRVRFDPGGTEPEPLRVIGELRTASVSAYLGEEIDITAVAFNFAQVSPATAAVAYEYGYRVEIPLTVADLSGTINGSVELSWTPRNRVPLFFDGTGDALGGAWPISASSIPANIGNPDGTFIIELDGTEIATTAASSISLPAVAGDYGIRATAAGFVSEPVVISL